jgi:hypothetical protein
VIDKIRANDDGNLDDYHHNHDDDEDEDEDDDS